MSTVRNLDWADVYFLASRTADAIHATFINNSPITIYPIPRGGVYAAMAVIPYLSRYGHSAVLANEAHQANIYIDDIIDSGATRNRYHDKPFFSLVDKAGLATASGISSLHGSILAEKSWISFPWERMQNDSGIEENITRILQHIGEDPKRDGLIETPKRVAKSYVELFSGYQFDAQAVCDLMTTFDATCDEMIVLKGVEFTSFCEHHMLPFSGVAHIAYIPDGKVVGISKLARVLEVYTRRLQIQERICSDVVSALMDHLKPLGAACIIEAKHACMTCRGVMKQNSVMVTSALSPVFKKPEVRAELLALIKD